jgi:hypothetical protein
VEKRNRQHLTRFDSQVYKHIEDTKIIPILIKLTDYLTIEDAKKQEDFFISRYKDDNWNILNISKAGALGRYNNLNFEDCLTAALLYKNKRDFFNSNRREYLFAKRNGYLEEVCVHMDILKSPNGYWTKDRCREEALRYKTRSELKKNNILAYRHIRSNMWCKDLFSHMKKIPKRTIWTKERCREEALKFTTISEFKSGNSSAYNVAYKNKWLNEICNHFESKEKPKGYWTKEKCGEEALKYESRVDFYKGSMGVYSKSRKNKWLDEICQHMR